MTFIIISFIYFLIGGRGGPGQRGFSMRAEQMEEGGGGGFMMRICICVKFK